MAGVRVGEAAESAGWSPRMLRYLERFGLVVPRRTASGYRLYGLRELNQLRTLAELRSKYDIQISDLVFAARVRREPALRKAVDGWLAGADDLAWVEWEQRKHERLLEVAESTKGLMATTKRYDVKDLALAGEGKRRIEWADRQMPVLAAIRDRFEKEQPLAG